MTRVGRMWLGITAITLAAVLGVVFWAAQPMLLGGSFMGDQTEIIRRLFPLRVVQPEWIHAKHFLLMDWSVAESEARLAMLCALWIAAMVVIVYRHRKTLRTSQT